MPGSLTAGPGQRPGTERRGSFIYVSRVRPFPDPSPAVPAYSRLVASFLVFRDLPGVTRDQYAAAQNAAADVAAVNRQAGVPVAETVEAIDLRPVLRSRFR